MALLLKNATLSSIGQLMVSGIAWKCSKRSVRNNRAQV